MKTLPCESVESEIRWRRTSASTTYFPVLGSAFSVADLELWVTALEASVLLSLAAGIRTSRHGAGICPFFSSGSKA